MASTFLILTTVVLGVALAQTQAETQPLFDVLNAQADLVSFRAALSLAPDLAVTLAGAGNITILAPTDDAFVALALSPNTTEAQVVETRDPPSVAALLAYHVLNASYPSSAVTVVPTYVPTFLDDRYRIAGVVRTTVTGGQNVGVFLNGSEVTFLSGDLCSVTVTEADIAVPGGANITIHKIGGFLRVPANISTTLPELGTTNAAAGAFRDLAASGQLGAGSGAGADALDLLPDVTLFVPNDRAFQAAGSALLGAAGAGTVDEALLRGVLRYHIANGTVMFASEAADGTVTTLDGEGAGLTLSVVDGAWFVDTARVLVPNIILAGGVAHIIDTVLNPNATDPNRASLDPTASPTAAFSGASLVAETPFATGVTATTTLSIPPVLTTGPVVSATAGAAAAGTTPASAGTTAVPAADVGRRVAAVLVGALLIGVLVR